MANNVFVLMVILETNKENVLKMKYALPVPLIKFIMMQQNHANVKQVIKNLKENVFK